MLFVFFRLTTAMGGDQADYFFSPSHYPTNERYHEIDGKLQQLPHFVALVDKGLGQFKIEFSEHVPGQEDNVRNILNAIYKRQE